MKVFMVTGFLSGAARRLDHLTRRGAGGQTTWRSKILNSVLLACILSKWFSIFVKNSKVSAKARRHRAF
jgi:hypothetical protein